MDIFVHFEPKLICFRKSDTAQNATFAGLLFRYNNPSELITRCNPDAANHLTVCFLTN